MNIETKSLMFKHSLCFWLGHKLRVNKINVLGETFWVTKCERCHIVYS